MIKAIIKLTTISVLFSILFLTSCQSSAQKSDAADAKVQDAKQDLKSAENAADVAAKKQASAEEWAAFKADSEMKIKTNESMIADLKATMKATGKKLDAKYVESVDALEQKNKALKTRMDAYGANTQSDWDSFKREFNHDMESLGQAFKDLTVNNKK